MDFFAVAAEVLGDIKLSSGQLAQLRAIDRKYQQRLYTLLHDSGVAGTPSDSMGGARDPTAEEAAELRAMIESDIREIVATKQPGFIDSH
ncbi:MAG: hypothetical protein M3373_04875 [Gemmatimonadota bacterium]|nr:hypothetical protein [Gemmatimonadota bacterium]